MQQSRIHPALGEALAARGYDTLTSVQSAVIEEQADGVLANNKFTTRLQVRPRTEFDFISPFDKRLIGRNVADRFFTEADNGGKSKRRLRADFIAGFSEWFARKKYQ